MRKEAAVPGFRPGRAPVTLVQRRFKKEVAGQVKSALLMGALQQIDEDYKINPISRPELNLEEIELPEDEPLTFEMDVEVQPDFPLPAHHTASGLTMPRLVQYIPSDRKYLLLYAFAKETFACVFALCCCPPALFLASLPRGTLPARRRL